MRKKKVVISSNSVVGSSLGSSTLTKVTAEESDTENKNKKIPDWIKFSKILCKYDGSCTRPGCWYKHTVPCNPNGNISVDRDGSIQDFSVFIKNLPLCTTFDERLDLSNYLRGIAKSFGHVTKCLVHMPRHSAKSSTGNIHFKSSESATDFIDYIHLKFINGHTFHAAWNGPCKYCSSDTATSDSQSSSAFMEAAIHGLRAETKSEANPESSSTPVTLRSTRMKKVVQDNDGFCLAGKNGKKVVIESDASESDSDGPELEENGW